MVLSFISCWHCGQLTHSFRMCLLPFQKVFSWSLNTERFFANLLLSTSFFYVVCVIKDFYSFACWLATCPFFPLEAQIGIHSTPFKRWLIQSHLTSFHGWSWTWTFIQHFNYYTHCLFTQICIPEDTAF